MLITFLCSFVFVGAYVGVVGMIATGFTEPALPDWAKGPILAWMFDIPQGASTDAYPNEGMITMYGPSNANQAGNGNGGANSNQSQSGNGGGAGESGNGSGSGLTLYPSQGGPNLGKGYSFPNLHTHMQQYPGSRIVPWDGYLDLNAGLPDGLPFKGRVKLWSTWYDKPPLGCTFHDSHYTSHEGQDFPVESGTPIYSTMAGEVVFAGKDGPYGNLVVVENGDYQAWFAHQEKFNVQKGDIVQAGDLLGWSDNTGNSTGSHVHYGVLYKNPDNGNYYWEDPRLYFSPGAISPWGCGDK